MSRVLSFLRVWPVLERRLIVAGVLLIGALTLTALVALMLARATPAWWSDAVVPPGPARAEAAGAVERGLTAALYSHPADGSEWTIELKQADANAWLAERFPRWIANRGVELPPSIGEVRAGFHAGAITLGVERPKSAFGRVLSCSTNARVDAHQMLAIEASSVSIGRMAIPGVLMPLDGPGVAGEPDFTAELLAGRSVSRSAWIELDDGRRVVIRSISIVPGALRVTCVTEPAARRGEKGGAP